MKRYKTSVLIFVILFVIGISIISCNKEDNGEDLQNRFEWKKIGLNG